MLHDTPLDDPVFFNDTATTEIYTLSLHDALPILRDRVELVVVTAGTRHSETKKRLAKNVDHVVESIGFIFANVDRRMDPFSQEPEARAQYGFVEPSIEMATRRFKQVSGDVLEHELIVGNILVEGANHIVTIFERVGRIVIELMAS